MARQTRQQRRERRSKDGTAPATQPRPARAPLEPAAAAPPEPPRPPRRPGAEDGGGAFRFFRESYGELQKVEWPGQRQVVQGTIVVLIACLIVGAFLYASDQAFKHLVEQVFLR